MANLIDLANRVRSFIQKNPTPVGFAMKPIQQGIQSFAQRNPNVAGTMLKYGAPAIENTAKFLSNPYKPVSLPSMQMSAPKNQVLDSILKVPQAGYNYLAKPFAEGIINAPTNYVGGVTRTGIDLGRLGRGEKVPIQSLAGNVGSIGKAIMDVSIPGATTGLAKAAAGAAGKHGIIKIAAEGAKQGLKFGAQYGLLGGLSDNREVKNLTEYIQKVLGSTAGGAAGGALVGGVTAGGGAVVGKAWNKAFNFFKNKGLSDVEAKSQAMKFFRDEAGRFTRQEAVGKEPRFNSDLRRELGMEPIVDAPIIGMQNRPKGGSKAILEAERLTKEAQIPQLRMQPETAPTGAKGSLLSGEAPKTPLPGQQTDQIGYRDLPQSKLALDQIIEEGRKQIKSGAPEGDKRSIRQAASDLYTQWVDRYNPIVKASQKAKAAIRIKGAELRPEYDPEYLVRRLTGAGGIADSRFQRELQPVLDQMDQLKIDKLDLDTYLANKRIAGFGKAGREVYGSDPVKATGIVNALEQKYGEGIKGIADQLYGYQNKGFQEMVDAGFISPESAQTIKQQNPDYSPLFRAMDEASDYLGLPTRKTMQGTQPIAKLKGSTRDIESPLESIIGNTFTQRAAIEKNRVAKAIVGLQEMAPELGFQKVKESGNDTITVWNNGQKEFWTVGPEIAQVAKGVNEESMNMVLKILQAPASLLRQGATGRNPEFMIPNIIRDQLDAGVSSKYGYIPFVDYVSGLRSMISNDDVYMAWEKSGAKIDLGELSGKKSIAKLFDEKTAKKNLFSWISKGLDVMGEFSEVPTRVGLFKKAYKKTGNPLIGAMESRDATVDFARMGSKMKVANSIIPFLNVGVQGFDKLIRSVKNNPAKVLFTAGIYGATPQILTTLYNLQNHPEEYAEIPQYEKDSNFVLIQGRNKSGTVNYVTFPKGNIIPTISNPIQSFLEYAYGANQQSFGEMATSLISEALPVLSPGSSIKEVALKTIGSNIPQAVKPLAETLLNKSFYKYDSKKEESKDIVPYFLKDKPAYEQSYEFTPEMYKKIGAIVNASPLQVQSVMEGYLAGYSKIPAQVVQMLTKASRGDEINTNDKTILRRFIKETYPSGGSKEAKPTPETPGIMERVFGKAEAAEKLPSTLTEDQIHQKDLNNRDKLRYSKESILESDGKIYLKKVTESGVSIDTIDPKFQPSPPTLTGNVELDKKAKSKFSGEVTKKANDIYALYESGKLTADEAEKQLNELKAFKAKVAGGGKGKKPPKITVKKITAKTIKMSMPSAAPKVQNIKIAKPPKLAKVKTRRSKSLSVKPIKIAKIKGIKIGTRLA